eukprot:3756798-Rhodomonas_salina.1
MTTGYPGTRVPGYPGTLATSPDPGARVVLVSVTTSLQNEVKREVGAALPGYPGKTVGAGTGKLNYPLNCFNLLRSLARQTQLHSKLF